VNANKITDKLTINITSVNGRDVKTASGQGFISINSFDFSELTKGPFVAKQKESYVHPLWVYGGIAIDQYTGPGGNVVIPSQIGRWQVSCIGSKAFDSKKITAVTLPSGLLKISYSAFIDNQLTSVTLPSGLTEIEGQAFSGNRLTSVIIPSGVTSIKERTFIGNRLTSVIIPSGVTSIGMQAFYENRLTSVTVPSSVTYIADYAFSNNPLTSITLPGNLGTGRGFWNVADGNIMSSYSGNGEKAGTYVRTSASSQDWRLR
jgi:hypothetical protein